MAKKVPNPFFRLMLTKPRIFLDNAATSWPKPPAVYQPVDDYQRRLGAAVGRGGSAGAEEVGKAVDETRATLARFDRGDMLVG